MAHFQAQFLVQAFTINQIMYLTTRSLVNHILPVLPLCRTTQKMAAR
jgi:hypothetical protein